ncbi:MAG: glycosyltransferase family 9 protein [Ignavibacteriales bacterium]|nr:glycosyltransferase family 9 protein [Ignavibacteriales bacterium]
MIEPKNLLIVRTDRIGDVVLSLPMAGIVKKHFPKCKITFLTREYTKSLVINHPQIDNSFQLIENKNKILLWTNVKVIRKFKFDSCIIVYPSFTIALIIFLSGIRNRIGTGFRWYSFLFNIRSFEHRKYAERHELEYNLNLLRFFNIVETPDKKNINFNLPVSKKSELKVEQLLLQNEVKLNLSIIIFHPGSGGSAVDLPFSKMKNLITRAAQELGVNIILTGNEAEKKLCEDLSVNSKIKNLAGIFNLEELIALINKSEMLIANSTGPIHIAAALGKHVVGFYPKIKACSPERWGPYSEKSFIFQPTIDCKNCNREQCERLNCMDSIDIDKVFGKIKSMLHI